MKWETGRRQLSWWSLCALRVSGHPAWDLARSLIIGIVTPVTVKVHCGTENSAFFVHFGQSTQLVRAFQPFHLVWK